jgi:beta-barrel assembly-enhancing protease
MAQLGISFGVGSYFLKNSRSAETEADLLGTDVMYDSGYDPHQMAVFFAKLAEEGGSRGPQFLSDHPDPGNRSQRVSQEVNTLPRKQYSVDSAEFRSVKQRVAGMKALTAQEIAALQKQTAGTSGGSITPSSAMKAFTHNHYKISYPENWQVFGDQTSSVTIAPQSGVSENAIAYGAMINTYQPEESSASLDQATHELLTSLRQSNPDMRAVGNDENIRVNGVSGKSVDLLSTSPIQDQGKAIKERDWLVTFKQSDGSLLYLIFIAPDKDFGSLRPTFEQMLKSVQLR